MPQPVGSCSSNSKGGSEFSHRLTDGSQPTPAVPLMPLPNRDPTNGRVLIDPAGHPF